MSASTIRSKLKTKLGQMRTIKAAYDWETSNPDGNYPFATVTLKNGTGEFRSTAHNLRRQVFRIRIYQERTQIGQGPESAENIVASVLDELTTACDMDTTLSGTCKYVTPVRWDAGYQDRDHDTRILEIDVEAVELVSSQ